MFLSEIDNFENFTQLPDPVLSQMLQVVRYLGIQNYIFKCIDLPSS